MNRITTENIVSSLLVLGFDRVDSLLYSYVLGKITLENKQFSFSDEQFSGFFNSVVDYDELGFRLKPGYTLDTNVSLNPTSVLPLQRMLNVNPVLLDYLKQFDFREVIYRKIQACNFNLDNLSSYFCKKEKEIIADMFGIDDSVSIFKKAYELEFGDEIPDIPFMRAEDIHTLKRTK